MEMTLHALVRYEFRAAMLRHLSQHAAFDEAADRVLVQRPELSTDATRRLVALMLSNEPLDIRDTAEPANLAAEEDEAKGYKAFCQHYRMEPTRNNAGIAHENGSVEASHGNLKRTLKEALTLRGSRDFADLAGYQAFLAETIARENAQH